MSDKEKNVVLNFKMDGQVEYAKTIRDINAIMNAAAKEYRNHITAMGQDATATQKLAAEKKKLEIQMQAAKERTEMLRDQYEAMAKNSKTTTGQLAQMHGKLMDAEAAEMALEKAMNRVNDGLTEQAETSRRNQEALDRLQKESSELESQMGKLNSEFELQKSTLGENATEAEKAALAHDHLGKKSELVEKQIANMEKQLEIVKAEFGENSIEANKMETELNEAKTAFNNLGKEMDGIKSSSDNATASMDGLTKVLSSAVLMEIADRLSAISDKIIEIGSNAVSAAAEMRASNAQFSQVFGEMEDEAQAIVERLGDSFGILPNRIKPAYSALASQFMSLGMDQKKAMELAADATTAAADAAAFYDLSLEDAQSRIQSFLKGNLSAAEGIGVFATANQLAAYAISNGFVEATEEQEKFAKKMELAIESAQRNVEKAVKKYGEDSLEARKATQKLNEELEKQEKGLNLKNKWDEFSEAQKQAVRADYILKMQEMGQVTGQAAREMDGWENVVGNAKSAMDDFQAAIGEPALEMFTEVLQTAVPILQGLGEWFTNLNPTVKQFMTIFAGVVAAIGVALPIFVTVFAALAAGAAAAGTTIGAFITGTLLPIIGIVAAVVAAITALVLVIQNWGEITNWLNDKFSQFGIDITGIWGQIKEAFNAALSFIKDIVTNVMTDVTQFFSEQLDKIKEFWNENGQQIMAIVEFHLEQIWSTIQMVMGLIKGIFEVVWPIISGVVKVAWETIKTAVKMGIDLVLGIIQTVMKLMQGDWAGAWETIKETVKNIWNNIVSFFEGVNLIQIGKDIIQGLVNGIGSMAEAVWEKAKSIAEGIEKAIKTTLGIASPSRAMKQIGLWTGEGLVIGLEESSPRVNKAMSDIGDGILAVSNAYQKEYANLIDDFNKKNIDKNDKTLKKIYQIRNNAAKKKRALTKKELQDIASLEAEHRNAKLKAERDFNKKYKALVEKSEKEYLEVIKSYIADKKSLDELSLSDEAAIWEQSIELFAAGTKERIAAQKEYKKSVEAVNKELTSINKQYADEMQKINDELKKQIDDLNKAYDDAVTKRAQSLQSFKGIFDEFSWEIEKSGHDLLANLRSQVDGFEIWQQEMEKFASKAVDEGLIAELREMGPKALPELMALNQLTDVQLTEYSELYQKKMSLAREQAESELIGMKKDTEKRIIELRKAANKKLDELQSEWTKAIRKITQTTSDEFKSLENIGRQAGQNLLDGLSSMEDALVMKAQEIAAAVNDAMAGALGTPSINTMSFDTQWNAKGAIFTQPTIFGASGGKLQGAGEAGPEAVLPLNDETLGAIGKGIAKTMGGANITINSRDDAESIARAVDRVWRRYSFRMG